MAVMLATCFARSSALSSSIMLRSAMAMSFTSLSMRDVSSMRGSRLLTISSVPSLTRPSMIVPCPTMKTSATHRKPKPSARRVPIFKFRMFIVLSFRTDVPFFWFPTSQKCYGTERFESMSRC